METQAIDKGFQETIQCLGLLSQNENNFDGFITVYQQALEDNYNQMMQCRNVDKLLAHVYQSRAEMLKTLLQRQLDYFGLTWPESRGQKQ